MLQRSLRLTYIALVCPKVSYICTCTYIYIILYYIILYYIILYYILYIYYIIYIDYILYIYTRYPKLLSHPTLHIWVRNVCCAPSSNICYISWSLESRCWFWIQMVWWYGKLWTQSPTAHHCRQGGDIQPFLVSWPHILGMDGLEVPSHIYTSTVYIYIYIYML